MRRRRRDSGLLLLIIIAVVVIFFGSRQQQHSSPQAAIAYTRAQLGKPYLWGGAGPDAFDCSGLIQQAYHWGASLRTSQQQWADLHHVSKPEPGDLVFFRGLLQSGEQPPGHVGIIVSVRRHLMIDAYAAGYGVEYDSFGLASSKPGLGAVWGYARP